MTFAFGILVGALGMILLSLIASIVLMRAAPPGRQTRDGFEFVDVEDFQAQRGAEFADSLSHKH